MYRGLESCFLHVFKRVAGTPSGPADAVAFISAQAASISSGLNSISSRLSAASPEKCSAGSVTVQSGLGAEKTELYCCLKVSTVKATSGFNFPDAGSRKGPIFDLVFCLDLANQKEDFGLDLMLKIA